MGAHGLAVGGGTHGSSWPSGGGGHPTELAATHSTYTLSSAPLHNHGGASYELALLQFLREDLYYREVILRSKDYGISITGRRACHHT